MAARTSHRLRRGYARRRRHETGAFGDDVNDLLSPTLDDPTRQFQADILAQTRAIQEHEAERIRKEELRGWVQIAATLSIPLAAAAWRFILGRRKSST